MADDRSANLTELTATIVANYVTHNKVEAPKLAEIIGDVHRALGTAASPAPAAEPETPKADKAAIRKSMTPDYLVSFEDGRHYKSLKRHLSTAGLTPDEYRAKWGLPKDYPMVAASYSAKRSALAKTLGLGRKAAALEPAPAPESTKKARKAKAIKPADETFT